MNRSDAIQKAAIVREERRTFVPSNGEDKTHDSCNKAKRYVRNFFATLGSIHETHKVCITGKGIIKQVKHSLELQKQRSKRFPSSTT